MRNPAYALIDVQCCLSYSLRWEKAQSPVVDASEYTNLKQYMVNYSMHIDSTLLLTGGQILIHPATGRFFCPGSIRQKESKWLFLNVSNEVNCPKPGSSKLPSQPAIRLIVIIMLIFTRSLIGIRL